MIDLTQIEQQLLQIIAIIILTILGFIGKRILAWMGIKLSDAGKAELEDAVGKSLTYGLAKSTDLIKAKGWDHADVKNKTIQEGLAYVLAKFPDAMARAGIDSNNPVEVFQKLSGLMERKFPEAVTLAAASPATPPAPVVSVAVTENKGT